MGIWDWIVTLFSHWQIWASGGGLGGAVLLVINLLQLATEWKMNKAWQLVLFLVFFVVGASYMAWRDERKKIADLQLEINSLQRNLNDLTVPIFEIEVLQANIGSLESGDTQIVFVGNLTNKGAAAAVIGNTWSAKLVTSDGATFKGSPALLAGIVDLCQGDKIRRFVPEDALYVKASTVVERNGYQQGALGWTFHIDKKDATNPRNIFELSAEAVGGTRFIFNTSIAELQAHGGESIYMPGLKFPALLDKRTAGPSPCK